MLKKGRDTHIGYREKVELVRILDKLAEAKGVTRSSLVRQIVRNELSRTIFKEGETKNG